MAFVRFATFQSAAGAALALLAFCALARAAGAGAPAGTLAPSDPAHGGALATGKATCQSGQCTACFTCHGKAGAGDAAAGYPRLARQSYGYIVGSLSDFASGARKSQVMNPIASALSEAERRDLAAYYAFKVDPGSLTGKVPPPAPTQSQGRGRQLAEVGDAASGVQGCANCHGPRGSGLPPLYPALAGQPSDYLKEQLEAFRAGSRPGGPYGTMAAIAKQLSDADMDAVGRYYASIQPVPVVAQSINEGSHAAAQPSGDDPGTAP
jgi:cytochrome c553